MDYPPEIQSAIDRFELPVLASGIPNARDTWHGSIIIPTTGPAAMESPPMIFRFNWPTRIVAAHCIVKPQTPGDPLVYDADDILVSLAVLEAEEKTFTRTAQDQAAEKFVPLSSLSYKNRLLMRELPGIKPDLYVKFRPRTATTNSSGLPTAAYVGLTLFTQPLVQG